MIEEEFYFPVLEEKLGKGALSGNIEQHKGFAQGLEALEKWCKIVQKGEVGYDGKVFLGLVEAFSDILITHLNDVRVYSIYSFVYSLKAAPFPTIGNPDFGPQGSEGEFYRS